MKKTDVTPEANGIYSLSSLGGSFFTMRGQCSTSIFFVNLSCWFLFVIIFYVYSVFLYVILAPVLQCLSLDRTLSLSEK